MGWGLRQGCEAGAWHQGQTVSEIMSMATRFAAMVAAEAGRGGRVLSFGGQPAAEGRREIDPFEY